MTEPIAGITSLKEHGRQLSMLRTVDDNLNKFNRSGRIEPPARLIFEVVGCQLIGLAENWREFRTTQTSKKQPRLNAIELFKHGRAERRRRKALDQFAPAIAYWRVKASEYFHHVGLHYLLSKHEIDQELNGELDINGLERYGRILIRLSRGEALAEADCDRLPNLKALVHEAIGSLERKLEPRR